MRLYHSRWQGQTSGAIGWPRTFLTSTAIRSSEPARAQTTCRFPPPASGKKTLQALHDPGLRPLDKKTTGRKAAAHVHNAFQKKDYGMRKYKSLVELDLRSEAATPGKKLRQIQQFLGAGCGKSARPVR